MCRGSPGQLKGRFVAVAAMLLMSNAVLAADSFIKALTEGKVDLFVRYRYEFVNDDAGDVKNANAHTVRTALGYSTGLFHGFGVHLQMQDVRSIGSERFNDGGANQRTQFATVVDPKGTRLQQANLRFEGLENTVFKVGRQEIEHRQAPMHRYVGNILWRQNWQNFDAFRVTHSTLPGGADNKPQLHADYAYAWQVNRIFGPRNDMPDRRNIDMDSHMMRVQYTGLPYVNLEGYGYLLDFDGELLGTRALSTNTFGIRADGAYGLGEGWSLLYTAEFANQRDAGNNPAGINVNYYLGELGFSYRPGLPYLDTLSLKASYEVLEGKGSTVVNGTPVARAFQTPLGTNHAFQGWADRFLLTPADGIEDFFVTLRASAWGANFMLAWHKYWSNRDRYSYGDEWNVVLERPFAKHWLVGVKYASYAASTNSLNVARNSGSGQAFDVDKFWAYIQFRF